MQRSTRGRQGFTHSAFNHLVELLLLPAGDLVLRTEFTGTLRRWREM